MKKLILGLLAAFLMATGLVAFSGSSASAACPKYQTCGPTAQTITVERVDNHRVKFVSTVVTKDPSNVTPTGSVKFIVFGKNGGRDRVKIDDLSKGGKAAATFNGLGFGRHNYKVVYLPKRGSAFDSSEREGHFFLARS